MNKITTAICKEEICKIILADPETFAKEFCTRTEEEFKQMVLTIINDAGKTKNWKRFSKCKENSFIQREFDCRPFDDQLRAYVWTDINDQYIIRILIQGE